MGLFTTILGFSVFGFTTRSFALSIQKRPVFQDVSGHVWTTIAFGWLGGFAYFARERSQVLLIEKQADLAQRREEEDKKWAAKKAAAADAHAI